METEILTPQLQFAPVKSGEGPSIPNRMSIVQVKYYTIPLPYLSYKAC